MHASSDIRYLKMSKSCKTDTNSYGAVAFPCLLRRKARKIKYGHQVFWTFNCLPIYLARERCGNPGLWNQLAGSAFDQGGTVGFPSRRADQLQAWFRREGTWLVTFMCDIRCPGQEASHSARTWEKSNGNPGAGAAVVPMIRGETHLPCQTAGHRASVLLLWILVPTVRRAVCSVLPRRLRGPSRGVPRAACPCGAHVLLGGPSLWMGHTPFLDMY